MTEPAASRDPLAYPQRRSGMDHDRYEPASLFKRGALDWPGGQRLAVWVAVSAEWFALDEPLGEVRAQGSLLDGYPDLWGYSRLDYGNRAGMRRVMDVLKEREIPVTLAMNSQVCSRYPTVVQRAIALGWELIGHGTTSSQVIHEGIDEAEERDLIHRSLSTLRSVAPHPVRGWLSPSLSESTRTPDLLSSMGVEYLCDWVNDDLPYPFRTTSGPIHVLPYSHELSDVHMIHELRHTASDYRDAISAHCRMLAVESERAGARCMCVGLHPWLIGAPHRVRYLAEALDEIRSCPQVWLATAGEIVDAYVDASRLD